MKEIVNRNIFKIKFWRFFDWDLNFSLSRTDWRRGLENVLGIAIIVYQNYNNWGYFCEIQKKADIECNQNGNYFVWMSDSWGPAASTFPLSQTSELWSLFINIRLLIEYFNDILLYSSKASLNEIPKTSRIMRYFELYIRGSSANTTRKVRVIEIGVTKTWLEKQKLHL